jgi:hypothetical protein
VEQVMREVAARVDTLAGEPGFPAGYVDEVRAATGWLAADPDGADGGSVQPDVRRAALILDRQAAVNLEPPMTAADLPRRLLKKLVRRLVGWYVRFLGQQVAALGHASSRLGLAIAARIERIEADEMAEHAALRAEIAGLAERVAALEARLGD